MIRSLPPWASRVRTVQVVAILLGTLLSAEAWGAVITVGRCATPPTIDGALEDACWKDSFSTTLLPDTEGAPLRDATEVRLCFDREAFYVAARCRQDLLRAVLNRLDDAQPKARQRDAAVYDDDCVEVFLLMKESGSGRWMDGYYHVALNMAGVLFDEVVRNKARDTSWNPKVTVATRQGDGVWTAELRIPFAEMNAPPPHLGHFCYVKLFRANPLGKELAALVPSAGDFHAGKITPVFLEETCPASFQELTPVDAATARVILDTAPGARLLLKRRLLLGGGEHVEEQEVAGGGRKEIALRTARSLLPGRRGRLTAVIEAWQGGKRIFETPPLFLGEEQAKYSVTWDPGTGGSRLTINGSLVAAGPGAKEIEGSLLQGVNVVAIEARGALPRFELRAEGERFDLSGAWKQSDAPAPEWTALTFSDASWQVARPGPGGGTRYLRKTLVFGHAAMSPPWENDTGYFAAGCAHAFGVRMENPVPREVAGASFHLVLPNGVSLGPYEADGRRYTRQPHRLVKTPLPDGSTHYRFAFSQNLPNEPYNWGVRRFHLIGVGGETAERRELEGAAWWEAEGGSIRELKRPLRVVLLPQRAATAPERKLVQMWVAFMGKCQTEGEATYRLDTLRRMGMNSIGTDTYWAEGGRYIARARALGIETCLALFSHHDTPLGAFLEEKGVERGYVNALKPPESWTRPMCPEMLLRDAPPALDEAFRIKFREQGYDVLVIDNEFSPPGDCFCERCRERFREYAKADRVYTQKEIVEGDLDRWTEFCCKRNVALTGHLARLAKRHNPRVRLGLYSGYQSERTRNSYGIDWADYRGRLDLPTCGYGRPLEQIKATREALGGQALVLGEHMDSGLFAKWPPQEVTATLWRRFVDGGLAGILVYMDMSFDGRGAVAISDFARGVARFEDFLEEKLEAPSAGLVANLPAEDVHLYRRGREQLLLLINDRAEARQVTLTLPTAHEAEELTTGRRLALRAGRPEKLTIPAHNVALVHLQPWKGG